MSRWRPAASLSKSLMVLGIVLAVGLARMRQMKCLFFICYRLAKVSDPIPWSSADGPAMGFPKLAVDGAYQGFSWDWRAGAGAGYGEGSDVLAVLSGLVAFQLGQTMACMHIEKNGTCKQTVASRR